jgi:pantoate--beta-alanine ligase
MNLQLVSTVAEARDRLALARARGQRVGLVPTMGALHAGHASLMARARAETDYRVVSIFVNPTQFGPQEDLARYPRTPEQDLAVCTRESMDLVFAPQPATIYPPGYRTYLEVAGLQDVWEGASRPGHFRGVATVVAKLFNILQPHVAYFGQKDAQQAVIIRRLVRDLDIPVLIQMCPIVREPDGLALSSRNRYLTPSQRRQATVLFEALEAGRRSVEAGERDPMVMERRLAELINARPEARLDYIAIVRAEDLTPLVRLSGNVLVALAVRFGDIRLIDNLILESISG